MKLKLIYPKWPKMPNQPEFHLPPHGPVCFASTLPETVEIEFTDENVEPLVFDTDCDLVAISSMLTCQIPRGWEIADQYRAMGKTVVFGGIAPSLHTEETMLHADSVFIGEADGRMEQVLTDFRNGELRPLYDFIHDFPDTSIIKPARRDILNRELYNYRGVQMVDLVHASRGCRFNCFPCCTPYLGGCKFRPRPIDQVIEEMAGIDNNRLFVVDNSLAQDDQWEKDLFKAMIPLKKKWVSHPIKDDPEILDLAAEAGCWYVYQAIFDTSDVIRDRIKRLKERGIGVEGTIILGTDDHDEDGIKRLVDFLLEVDLDLAEFTIMTPFPHTPIREQMVEDGRVLHNDWRKYTGDQTVFQPAKMSVEKLDEMHQYAWDTFYGSGGKEIAMGKLYRKVIEREVADGTYKKPKTGPQGLEKTIRQGSGMKVLLISANVATSPYPIYPIGMSMVAAALKKEGHEVELFDFLQNGCSFERVEEAVEALSPGLVGISIRNVDNVNLLHEQRYIEHVRQIVQHIKEQTPVPVILGGSGFSVMPDEVLVAVGADYGVVGEGEALLCEFIRGVEKGNLPTERILRAPQQLVNKAIPSAHYDPDMLGYYLDASRVISIQTKRGCDKHCIYCSYPTLEGRELRMRNVTDVVDDIERLTGEGADYIFFVDSVFNDSQGNYRQLIDEMVRREINVPWTAFFTPGGELDDEIVAKMKSTGLHAAEMGADASTDATLRGLCKDFLWQDVIDCNDLFNRHEVTTAHYYMFGGPGETPETVQEGIQNICALPHTANFMFMGIRILPGTPLMDLARREGLITEDQDILEPVYYVAKEMDHDWLEKTLTDGFAGRVNCVFPPDAMDDKLVILHEMGFSGNGYDMLIKQSESPRRRAAK